MVVHGREGPIQPQFNLTYHSPDNRSKLQICELEASLTYADPTKTRTNYLFSDTSMSTSSKWLVRTFGPFANHTEAIINLFAALVRFECLCSNPFRVTPSRWIPKSRISPH